MSEATCTIKAPNGELIVGKIKRTTIDHENKTTTLEFSFFDEAKRDAGPTIKLPLDLKPLDSSSEKLKALKAEVREVREASEKLVNEGKGVTQELAAARRALGEVVPHDDPIEIVAPNYTTARYIFEIMQTHPAIKPQIESVRYQPTMRMNFKVGAPLEFKEETQSLFSARGLR